MELTPQHRWGFHAQSCIALDVGLTITRIEGNRCTAYDF